MNTDTLSDDHLDEMIRALLSFRDQNGIQFKRKLRDKFFSADRPTCQLLINFRQNFWGCLDKIKQHTTREELKEILLKHKGRS